MIQRIGRTGRKKNGQVILLATQGKEEQVWLMITLSYYTILLNWFMLF